MFEKIDGFIQIARRSPRFQNVISQRAAPAKQSDISALAAGLSKAGMDAAASAPLLEFYRRHDGLTLRWEYAQLTHPDYITAGNTSIAEIGELIEGLNQSPNDLIVFDAISDLRQVMIRVGPGGLVFRYLDKDTGTDHPFEMDFARYFRLLDECRALRPWQELLVPSFKLAPVLRKKFIADLKLLFDDANPSLFDPRRQ